MTHQNRIVYKINKNIHDVIYTKNIVHSLEKKIIDLKSDKKIIFLYDENISNYIIKDILLGLKLTGCKISSKKIKSLKKNKNIKSVLDLIDTFTRFSLTKKSVVITCGGGVIGDLAGLASSLYKRGLIYINIPSTMTALVDSCIGGKTGINHNKQINLIGTYFHPTNVIIYEKILETIPEREYISGQAEIIKSFIISNKGSLNIFNKNITKILNRQKDIVKKLILDSLKIKIEHFTNDVFEKNKRLLLNFGHTFGHAYEMATDDLIKKDYLRHGEAVSLGIISEIALSYLENKKSSQRKKIYKNLLNIESILKNLKLPTKLTFHKKIEMRNLYKKIFFYVFQDKKKISNKPIYINFKDKGKLVSKEIENFDDINKVIYYILNNIDLRTI
jgi:3-dehydroquinate synthetase